VAKSASAPATPSAPDPEQANRREQRAASDAGTPRERPASVDSRAKQDVGASETAAPSRQDMAPRALERSVGAAAARAVDGRLVVASLASAEREVTAVVSRLKARLEARGEDADGLRLTIDVPAGAYPELARALGEIGSFSILGEPGTPTEPTHLVLRITR
jgi:hypothetical protein